MSFESTTTASLCRTPPPPPPPLLDAAALPLDDPKAAFKGLLWAMEAVRNRLFVSSGTVVELLVLDECLVLGRGREARGEGKYDGATR